MTIRYFYWNFQIRVFMFVHLWLTCTRETASDIVSLTKVYHAPAMCTDRSAFQNFLRAREVKKWKLCEKKSENRLVWPSLTQSDMLCPAVPRLGSTAWHVLSLLALLTCSHRTTCHHVMAWHENSSHVLPSENSEKRTPVNSTHSSPHDSTPQLTLWYDSNHYHVS